MVGNLCGPITETVPPVYSSKRAIRQTYARAINAAGTILCEILSDANGPQHRVRENKEVSHKLMTWRSKLGMVGLPATSLAA